ncbi:MAG: TIGR03943 family putative permease subunit [Sarcina sp.]
MRRFNLNEFVWFLILISLLLLLTYMLFTEEIFLLINIKMKKYIILSIIILLILLIVQLTQIFTIPPRGGVKFGYIIFFMALIILSILPNVNVIKTSLNFKGVQLYHNNHKNKSHLKDTHYDSNNKEILKLTSDNFHENLELILHKIDSFIGEEIYAEGIIYIDSNYENKFILTEIDMNCCIVDASYLGILCDIKNEEAKIEVGTSVKVIGKLDKYKIKDKNDNGIWVPLIHVYKLEENISD